MKDHRRLIKDTAALMRATYHDVFHIALAYQGEGDVKSLEKSAQWLLDKFVDTNIVPDYVEAFCLGVLTGRVPVVDKKGNQINKRGGK